MTLVQVWMDTPTNGARTRPATSSRTSVHPLASTTIRYSAHGRARAGVRRCHQRRMTYPGPPGSPARPAVASRTTDAGAERRIHAPARRVRRSRRPRPGARHVDGDRGDGSARLAGARLRCHRVRCRASRPARPPPPPAPGRALGTARGGRPARARTERRTVPVVASRNCVSRPSPPPLGSGCATVPDDQVVRRAGHDGQHGPLVRARIRRHRHRPGCPVSPGRRRRRRPTPPPARASLRAAPSTHRSPDTREARRRARARPRRSRPVTKR